MAEQITFDEWFAKHGKGLNGEARRLMQISWNAALTNEDRHFFVDELAAAIGYKGRHGTTWAEMIKFVQHGPNLP